MKQHKSTLILTPNDHTGGDHRSEAKQLKSKWDLWWFVICTFLNFNKTHTKLNKHGLVAGRTSVAADLVVTVL